MQLISQIVIYPMDSAIQHLNNRSLRLNFLHKQLKTSTNVGSLSPYPHPSLFFFFLPTFLFTNHYLNIWNKLMDTLLYTYSWYIKIYLFTHYFIQFDLKYLHPKNKTFYGLWRILKACFSPLYTLIIYYE